MKNLVLAALIFSSFISGLAKADINYSEWESRFKNSLKSTHLEKVKEFFSDDFANEEIESWKYSIQRGFLNYDSLKIFRISEDAIFFLIPTNDKPYDNENEDCYFDFIYRIYRMKQTDNGFLITERCMEDFNPDFSTSTNKIEVDTEEGSFLVESKIDVILKSNHLIFKLAKEFSIQDFKVNNENINYKKFGYFVYTNVNNNDSIKFTIKGKIKAPQDNNQFFSIASKCFFLRTGGFAAIPSPPPDNNGRSFFSNDETVFDMTIIYPSEYQLLQYGEVYKDEILNGQKVTATQFTDKWYDGTSFYAQSNWDVKFIEKGNTKIGFYFPQKDKNELTFLHTEVTKLLNWLNNQFQNYSEFQINFVVLENFYKGGLLNDSHSVIAQNAEIIGSDGEGYIHEVCHAAPQPQVAGNYLWIKEGFTNFLAFNYIDLKEGENEFWRNRKRIYLHYFDLYEEPLLEITSTRVPTYWAAYQKGPWVYRMLRSVIGEDHFESAMVEFGKMKGLELKDNREYFKIFERISGQDLSWFENQWLNWKENPVLRVHGQLETKGDNGLVRITVAQEGRIFKLPLEVEIQTERQNIRKIIWIDSEQTEFTMPLKAKTISIRYDPDSKLFASIKAGTRTFLNKKEIKLPEEDITYKFKSNKSNEITEFMVKTGRKNFNIIRTKADQKIALKITKYLAPIEFTKNGDVVYTIDMKLGKISFPEETYHIFEPIYPYELAVMLCSFVDWKKNTEKSFLSLRPGRKRCAISVAKAERISKDEIKVSIDMYYNEIELYLRNGIPVKYIVDEDETFELINL